MVTALFCDVSGSRVLGDELDPEALHGVMNRYFGELRAVIERHGGTVDKFIGDAAMAVFGIPRLLKCCSARACGTRCDLPDVGVELDEWRTNYRDAARQLVTLDASISSVPK